MAARNKIKESQAFITVIALTLVMVILRVAYVALGGVDVSVVEAQLWDLGRAGLWQAGPQAPFVPWMHSVLTPLFGAHELGVKGPAILFHAGSSLLLFIIVQRWRGAVAGLWAWLFFQVMPLFSYAALMMDGLAPMLFFTLAAVASLVAVTWQEPDAKGNLRAFAMAGLFLGVAALSSLSALVIYLLLVLFLLVNEQRHVWFVKFPLYVALLITAAVLTPIWYWYGQQGVGMEAMASDVSGPLFHNPVFNGYLFIKEQVLAWGGLLLLLALVAWVKEDRKRTDTSALIWWLSAPMFIFFIVLGVNQPVPMAAPLLAMALGLVVAAGWVSQNGRKAALFALLAALLAAGASVYWQVKDMQLRLTPEKQIVLVENPFTWVNPWQNMALMVDMMYERISGTPVILVETDEDAAMLAFYMAGNPRTLVLQDGDTPSLYADVIWPEEQLRENITLYIGQSNPTDGLRGVYESCIPLQEIGVAEGNVMLLRRMVTLCAGYGLPHAGKGAETSPVDATLEAGALPQTEVPE